MAKLGSTIYKKIKRIEVSKCFRSWSSWSANRRDPNYRYDSLSPSSWARLWKSFGETQINSHRLYSQRLNIAVNDEHPWKRCTVAWKFPGIFITLVSQKSQIGTSSDPLTHLKLGTRREIVLCAWMNGGGGRGPTIYTPPCQLINIYVNNYIFNLSVILWIYN